MFDFFVFVTALTDKYSDILLSGLVKKGYVVCAISSEHLALKSATSSCIAIKVQKEDSTNAKVFGDVEKLLSSNKAKYYSIVVVLGGYGAAWTGSNIKEEDLKPRPKVSHLKLVQKEENHIEE